MGLAYALQERRKQQLCVQWGRVPFCARSQYTLSDGQSAGERGEHQRCVGEAQAARVAGGKTAPHAPAGISHASDHWFLSRIDGRCCSQLYTDNYIQQKFSVQRWLEVPSQTYL